MTTITTKQKTFVQINLTGKQEAFCKLHETVSKSIMNEEKQLRRIFRATIYLNIPHRSKGKELKQRSET